MDLEITQGENTPGSRSPELSLKIVETKFSKIFDPNFVNVSDDALGRLLFYPGHPPDQVQRRTDPLDETRRAKHPHCRAWKIAAET